MSLLKYLLLFVMVISEATKNLLGETVMLTDSLDDVESSITEISNKLYNKVCAEASTTSKPIRRSSMIIGNIEYDVEVMLDNAHAKIWLVKNFITNSECETLESVGRPKLKAALIIADDGSYHLSNDRKASSAAYHDIHGRINDPIRHLYNRIIDLTNNHTSYNITLRGQDTLSITKYDINDEYRPHCDGYCDGSVYIPGERVASAVMYCKPNREAELSSRKRIYTYNQSQAWLRFSPIAAWII